VLKLMAVDAVYRLRKRRVHGMRRETEGVVAWVWRGGRVGMDGVDGRG